MYPNFGTLFVTKHHIIFHKSGKIVSYLKVKLFPIYRKFYFLYIYIWPVKTRYLPAVKKYIRLLEELPELIKNSPVKDKYLCEQLGMDERTFRNRKKLANWKPQEVKKVLEVLEAFTEI